MPDAPSTKLLGGLFDRPLSVSPDSYKTVETIYGPIQVPVANIDAAVPVATTPVLAGAGASPKLGDNQPCDEFSFGNDCLPDQGPVDGGFDPGTIGPVYSGPPLPGPVTYQGPCPEGQGLNVYGVCVPVSRISGLPITGNPPGPIAGATSALGAEDIININNTILDTGIQQVADEVAAAVKQSAQDAADIAAKSAQQVAQAVGTLTNQIAGGINAAFGGIANVIQSIASFVWNGLKAIFTYLGNSIGELIQSIKDNIGPILQNIGSVLDSVVKQIQLINDTLIQPLANLYTSTIGTISTLTVAIEKDLHDGLSGILKIPTDIANGLGSLDATLNRTIQQLGTINAEQVTSGVRQFGELVPEPFGNAMARALGGNILATSIKTTFGGSVSLSSESLQQVSSEAIASLGGLLKDILEIVYSSFKGTLDQIHTDWTSVGSVFTPLLDGLLGLITTVTAMGALTGPLIEAAEQVAAAAVPTRKLEPASVLEALRRGIISREAAIKEIKVTGLDETRIQTLEDLELFLADVTLAIDWWYRGIIADDDLKANMNAHGVTSADQQAILAGSVRLPTIEDLLRWMNFGIIKQDEFATNAKILRYDDAQIQATLDTYPTRLSPENRASLDGLLSNFNVDWLVSTSSIPATQGFVTRAKQAGYAPETIDQIWKAHWNIPGIDQFIQAYFRGIRTLTELQSRMAIANIPQELWDDIIQVNRPLIPFRSIPSYVKNGLITESQARKELAGHGFDLEHQQIILKAVSNTPTKATTTAANAVHGLSQANARTLWGEGAITDLQYLQILEAHGLTPDLAALQLKADTITEHIHQQKQIISNFTAEVQAGQITLDDASSQLIQQGFSTAQVSKFQLAVTKSLKIAAKHPSMSELDKFLKAGIITIQQYAGELAAQGWVDPWLSAFVSLVSPAPDTSTSTA